MYVYAVIFDGMPRFVEARSMSEAIRLWNQYMGMDLGNDWDGDDEPESVELLGDGPVIRG